METYFKRMINSNYSREKLEVLSTQTNMEMKENIKLKNILLHSINKTKEVKQT